MNTFKIIMFSILYIIISLLLNLLFTLIRCKFFKSPSESIEREIGEHIRPKDTLEQK